MAETGMPLMVAHGKGCCRREKWFGASCAGAPRYHLLIPYASKPLKNSYFCNYSNKFPSNRDNHATMAAPDKGFSFRRLFFRDTGTGAAGNRTPVSAPAPGASREDFIAYPTSSIPPAGQDQPLVEDFVQRLQNLINQNNQSGFDFLEFTESLFEEKQNPDPEIYKMVFRIAQKIDKTLTPGRLIESAIYYKDLVQRTADSEISKGETKKQGLQTEKDTEKTNLENNLRDARTKIQLLTRQIQDLQNQEVSLGNQLVAIDQKYNAQFIDIDRKINAIRNAKEQVVLSIVDIEAGIKSNLS